MHNECENRESVWEFRSRGRIRREKSERRENLEGRDKREESKSRQHNIKLIIQIIKVYIANSWKAIYRPQHNPKY